MGIGLDNVMHYYGKTDKIFNRDFAQSFISTTPNGTQTIQFLMSLRLTKALLKKFSSEKTFNGITITNVGFYGPQGRVLRRTVEDERLNEKIKSFQF